MRRLFLAVFWLAAVVAVVAAVVTASGTMIHAGVFTDISYTDNDRCTVIKSPAGAEDLAIDRETGWVYVSATDRRWGQGGGLYAMRLDAPERGIISLTTGLVDDLQPHGISLWAAPDGSEKRLFAVTHSKDGTEHAVEIFRIDDSGAQPVLSREEPVRDPLIGSPNDVAAFGPRSFYVTNDFANPAGTVGNSLELFLRWDATTLVLHDDGETRIAADGLTFANGVALNAGGDTVFVAETTDSALRVYDRNLETNDLTLREVIDIGPGPDNIDVDAAGRLWVARHPKLFAFQDHAANAQALSPSLVEAVTLGDASGVWVSEEVYVNDGAQISGASVGAFHDGRLVIGSVFEPHVVLCTEVE